MWSCNPAKQIAILVLVFLLLCFQASWSEAQQVSGVSPAVPDAGKSAGTQNADTQTQPPALQDKSSVGGSQTGNSANVPSIPGGTVRVLKEGEKLPQREDPDYENWGRPELTPGMRMEAMPMGTAIGDGFTREFWRVQWREMDPIDLWVIKPAGAESPPVVLYLYSYDGSNERYRNDDFCKLLTRDGFAAVGFVSALTEQRFHDRPQIETFVSQLQESLGTTTHDVQMILNFLEKRGDMDMNRVGMWADGSGAGIAIMASAVDPRIKVLDLLDPWGDWPDWIAKSSLVQADPKARYRNPNFLSQVANLDPLQYFPKVKAQKVRLQYIQEGISVTPATVMEKMEAAAPSNTEIVHYENTKTYLSDIAAKGIGFNWIKTNVSTSNLQNGTTKARLGGKASQSQ